MESAKIESLLGSTARYLKQRQHKEAARNLEELKIILRGKRDKIVEKELDIVVVLADTIGNCDGALEPLISVISAYCLLPDGIDRVGSYLDFYIFEKPLYDDFSFLIFQVGKTNATSQLLLILKYPKSESLSTRGLRLLGNLAQNVSIAEKLHREGATATVMSFVKNPEHSVETLTMAVRVMRYKFCLC